MAGDTAVTDPEGGNIIFEYIYFDDELVSALKLPTNTVTRVIAYFMNAQTPESNPLPTPGQCNNLVTTKGWPGFVAPTHTDLDVGTLDITGKNTAGEDVTISVPKQPKGTDYIGRPHDVFYQTIIPDAPKNLQFDSAYSVKFGGSTEIPATTLPDALFLAEKFDINMPDLNGNGPMKPGTDFTVHWTPATSAKLPPTAELVGGAVLGVTWLLDMTGVPTHMCPTAHTAGQFTIPGSAITEWKTAVTARGLPTNKMMILRNAIVHRLARLPNGDTKNKRRIDMLTLVCWGQLLDVQ